MRERGGGRSEVYEFEQPNLIKDQHNHNFVFFLKMVLNFFSSLFLDPFLSSFSPRPAICLNYIDMNLKF